MGIAFSLILHGRHIPILLQSVTVSLPTLRIPSPDTNRRKSLGADPWVNILAHHPSGCRYIHFLVQTS